MKWLIYVGHAAWMVILTMILMNIPFVHGDEAFLIKNTSVVLNTLLPEPEKPAREEVAFINVTWDRMLADRLDEFGMPAGNIDLTDRSKLTELYRVLNKNPNYRMLVTDIYFHNPTPVDSAFYAEAKKLPRALFSQLLDDGFNPIPSQFPDLNFGAVTYTEVEDEFLKFRLMHSEHKSMPVRMFEMLDGGTFNNNGFTWMRNGKPAFNDFVLNFYVRQYDIVAQDSNPTYALANLYDFDMMMWDQIDPDMIHNFTKDRIIIIGDFFERDMHTTMYGDMAGPLILYNLYLALHHGDNEFSIWFPVFLFFIYLLLSKLLFNNDDPFEEWLQEKFKNRNKFLQLAVQGASYMVVLALVSIASYLLFRSHINFLFLSFYVSGVEYLVRFLRKRRMMKLKEAQIEEGTNVPSM